MRGICPHNLEGVYKYFVFTTIHRIDNVHNKITVVMERDLVSKNLIMFLIIGKAKAVKYPPKKFRG